MANIQKVGAKEVLEIRQKVLRPGKPEESCTFAKDEEASSFHFIITVASIKTGILSLLKERHPEFQEQKQYRLRGMAVLPAYRGKSLGKELIDYSIKKLPETDLIWFNARLSAVDFYKKQNFQTKGETFDIPGVGPHVLMFKKLSNA